MMKKLILSACFFGLIGYSNMTPPRYSISVDNIQALKKFENSPLKVADITQSASYDANCRLMGPIMPADGLSVSQFIKKAFNDELKMANIYSDTGTKLSGDVTKVSFSSTSGTWDLAISLKSSNGKEMNIENKYNFKTSFDAITACNSASNAFTPAIQDLIKATVTSPEFKKML